MSCLQDAPVQHAHRTGYSREVPLKVCYITPDVIQGHQVLSALKLLSC